MWRSNIDADWERKKEYLIRSLFHDVPLLSPVQEEDESFDSNRLRIRPPTTYSPERPHSPHSPLPPLIVEREPNRHDEPEEYYKQLERKIKRIYRKLFIEGRSDVSSDDMSDYEEDIDLECDAGNHASLERSFEKVVDLQDEVLKTVESGRLKSKSLGDVTGKEVDSQNTNVVSKTAGNEKSNNLKRSITPESESNTSKGSQSKKSKSNDDDNSSSTEILPRSTSEEINEEITNSFSSKTPNDNDTNVNKDTEASETDSSGSLQDHRQVTFQAEVHREDGFTAPARENDGTIDNDDEVDDLSDGDDEDSEILDNNEVPENNHHTSNNDTNDDIEVMRTPRIRLSSASLHHHNHSEIEDIAMEEEPRFLEAHTESSSSNGECVSMDLEINFDLLHRISTPIAGERERTSSSCDEMSVEDIGIQTSFDREDVNRVILKDIFIAPKVFRLCSCVDHFCG